MAKNASRYQNSLPFSSEDGSAVVFKGKRARPIGPASGVLEYIVKDGDRLDLLALNFYADSRKWWRILDANPDIIFGLDLGIKDAIGDTILIPRAGEAGVTA